MPNAKMHPRDRFIENLRKYAPEIEREESGRIQRLKDYCVIFEYLSRPNHCGGLMMISETPERRRLSNGKWIEWKNVNIERIIENAEYEVERLVSKETRTQVWFNCFEGIEAHRKPAGWEEAQSDHPILMSPRTFREHFAKMRSEQIETTSNEPSTATATAKIRSADCGVPSLEGIDDTIDVTPQQASLLIRNYDKVNPLFRSCNRPGERLTSQEGFELYSQIGFDIDRDCDQIRACIARLIKYGDQGWTLDYFWQALSSDRKKLATFLQRRGPKEGARLNIYQAAWEFFKKRDLLGIPLPSADADARPEQAKKRKRAPLKERPANVNDKCSGRANKKAKPI